MPTMSGFQAAFCRSAPWRGFARRVVLPWALQGFGPEGEVLEIGAGSGAMAAELLAAHPALTMTVTDFDVAMVDAAGSGSAQGVAWLASGALLIGVQSTGAVADLAHLSSSEPESIPRS